MPTPRSAGWIHSAQRKHWRELGGELVWPGLRARTAGRGITSSYATLYSWFVLRRGHHRPRPPSATIATGTGRIVADDEQ
jgi:hypothetical protein